MRFLVDAQLPSALARWISEQGHEAEHVLDRGLAEADDRIIWDYAHAAHAVVVSKDEDFRARRMLNAEGPAIVWIRIGNASRRISRSLEKPAWRPFRRAETFGWSTPINVAAAAWVSRRFLMT